MSSTREIRVSCLPLSAELGSIAALSSASCSSCAPSASTKSSASLRSEAERAWSGGQTLCSADASLWRSNRSGANFFAEAGGEAKIVKDNP